MAKERAAAAGRAAQQSKTSAESTPDQGKMARYYEYRTCRYRPGNRGTVLYCTVQYL